MKLSSLPLFLKLSSKQRLPTRWQSRPMGKKLQRREINEEQFVRMANNILMNGAVRFFIGWLVYVRCDHCFPHEGIHPIEPRGSRTAAAWVHS